MKRRGIESRSVSSCVALALAMLIGACAWSPWIPGEGDWKPPADAELSTFAEFLPLDSVRVDELDCYSHRCKKRFRVIVEESGLLTVRLIPELVGPDAQARLVLEAIRGVLGQAGTGRGPRTDVTVLAVREPVNPGTYFVLVQSLGGPLRYELGAYLEPGPGPTASAPVPPNRVAPAEPKPPSGPPPRLVGVDLPGRAAALYDPAVSFQNLRTFGFVRHAQAGDSAPAGTIVEGPGERQVRRFLAEDLQLKGFRPGTGREPADLRVDFSVSDATRLYFQAPFAWYDEYSPGTFHHGVAPVPFATQANIASRLTVVIVENRSTRIAWHGTSEKSLGPGIDVDDDTTALAREAVSDILAKFPPN